MPTIWTYLRAAAVVVGSSAALLTGGIAHADPAPAPAPLPNIPQQLISSAANAPQILQNLALGKDWSEGVDSAIVMGTLAQLEHRQSALVSRS